MKPPMHLLLAVLAAAGCAADEPIDSFDLDVDPDSLADYEGKADGDVCADYPGGPLSGDDLLVLVNKEDGQQLRRSWSPPNLMSIGFELMMPGRSGALRAGASLALLEMVEAAHAEEGLELGVRSAYRSFRTQCITFGYKVQQHGLEHARRFSAEPGRSQHQLGTTVDISSPRLGWEVEQFIGDEPEGLWLAENAHRFGFALSYPEGREAVTGYAYEPWHYRYIGRDAAFELHHSGLILEEYLDACQMGGPGLECPREEPPEVDWGSCETLAGEVGQCMDAAQCDGTLISGLCGSSPSANIRCCI